GITILEYASLGPEQKGEADRYFQQIVFPVLTPLAVDPGRPFPHISNLSMNLAVVLNDTDGREHFARLKVPERLPQLVSVPSLRVQRKISPARKFVWIEELIAAN